jgi:hypothetical protein
MIITKIAGKNSFQMTLVHHDDMIQAVQPVVLRKYSPTAQLPWFEDAG